MVIIRDPLEIERILRHHLECQIMIYRGLFYSRLGILEDLPPAAPA